MYREIVAELHRLEDWRRELFATGCATRIQPLVGACASAATAELYQRGLMLAWDRADPSERAELAAQLEMAPEMAAESSAQRTYYALLPMTILTAVLRAGNDGCSMDIASLACAQALNASADIDYTLLPAEQRPRSINPAQPPPAGPLEAAEAAEQQDSIDLLRRTGSPQEGVSALQARAKQRASRLAEVLPEFVTRGDWAD
jgi:hypothetical protein